MVKVKVPKVPAVNVFEVALVKFGGKPSTSIVTVEGALSWVPLETTKDKVTSAGPAVCFHSYSSGRLLGSQLAEPSRCTVAWLPTVCGGPAIAVGAGSAVGTRICT